MTPTEKILDKLSKLKASREGEAAIGNMAAAEAFASAINRLLLQHELSEADIPLGGVVKDEPILELLVDLSQFGIKNVGTRIGWQEALARVVASAHLCHFMVQKGSNRIWFVGTQQHVAMAEYAYGVLASAADRMSFQAREDWWKAECGGQHLKSNGFRASWLSGFVQRIAQRFREARVKETAGATSTALMRLDQALVRAQAHTTAKYKTTASAASAGGANSAGYQAGRAAADAMKIGQKGVGTSTTKGRIG